MSHYAVAVFSDDGDFRRLLEKYGENNEKYFVFVPEENIRDKYDRFMVMNPNGDYTFDDFVKVFEYITVGGSYGHMLNPHGYWDWYTLGGREGMFDLKDGAKLDDGAYDYRKNDYDWYPDNSADAEDAAAFWDKYIVANGDVKIPGLFERYHTKEQYVKEAARTIPYAFITPDGEWHSSGKVGWFGMSNETDESANKYAEEWDAWIHSDANPYVNLVDCHI